MSAVVVASIVSLVAVASFILYSAMMRENKSNHISKEDHSNENEGEGENFIKNISAFAPPASFVLSIGNHELFQLSEAVYLNYTKKKKTNNEDSVYLPWIYSLIINADKQTYLYELLKNDQIPKAKLYLVKNRTEDTSDEFHQSSHIYTLIKEFPIVYQQLDAITATKSGN